MKENSRYLFSGRKCYNTFRTPTAESASFLHYLRDSSHCLQRPYSFPPNLPRCHLRCSYPCREYTIPFTTSSVFGQLYPRSHTPSRSTITRAYFIPLCPSYRFSFLRRPLYWIAMEVLFLTQAIDRVVTICSGMLLLIIIGKYFYEYSF